MQKLLLLLLIMPLSPLMAIHPYYPKEINQILTLNPQQLNQSQLREKLFQVLDSVHIKKTNAADEINDYCPTNETCYQQRQDMSYKEARQWLFGKLFLKKSQNGKFTVTDVYCQKTISDADGAGPNKIPDPNVLNCEHTWPQSKFNRQMNIEMQKVDLHHLFPVDSRANSVRSNNLFGELDFSREAHESCQSSLSGVIQGTNINGFLPPKNHRGNVARAIFYFALRYKMPIDNHQEKFLKIWDKEDPVDSEEKWRHDEIYKLQGNRNPFIDYPFLGSMFSDL